MTEKFSAFTSLGKPDEVPKMQINDGECGIILSPDGEHRIFSVNVDVNSLQNKDPLEYSEGDMANMAMGTKLMTLGLLLAKPELLDSITEALNDPQNMDHDMIKQIANPN